MSPEAQRLLDFALEWQQLATGAQSVTREMTRHVDVPVAVQDLAREIAARALVLAAALEGIARRRECEP